MSQPGPAIPPPRAGDPPLGLARWLFWDANPADIDLEKNASYVIQRVVEFGGLADWRSIRRHYGDERLRAVVTRLRSLSPRSVSFCCVALDLQPDSFRCCTEKLSHPAPWDF